MLAIVIGGLLTLLGLGGYGLGFLGDYASWTALIPAFVGIPLLLLGAMAVAMPNARKHLMHAAVALALLGALAPLGRLPATLSADEINAVAATSLIGMLLLCAFFVVAGVRSFIQARRSRPGSEVTQ